MSNILKQRRLLTRRNFELTSNSLKISVKTISNYFEGDFRFEEIGGKISRRKTYNRYALGALIIFLIGFVVTSANRLTGDTTVHVDDISFYTFFALVAFVIVLTTSKDTTNLSLLDGRHIVFFSNSPNKVTVEAYIQRVLDERKQFLLNKYAKPEPFLPSEAIIRQLLWLKDNEVIDNTEFEQLKLNLLPTAATSNPIGFTFNAMNN